MNICIIGWYGTETLGDRAILDGIISVFQKINDNNIYSIGSLFPMVTRRTFFEDKEIFSSHGGETIFNCFDIRDEKAYKNVLKTADAVVMGGGPLMGIQEMYIIEKAFSMAKRFSIPTIIFGCGYGPFSTNEYLNVLKKIVSKADLITMRSSRCKDLLQKLTNKPVYSLCDPAVFSICEYKYNNLNKQKANNLLCNIRDVGYVYNNSKKYIEDATTFLDSNSDKFTSIILYPMHTFSIGGDDREIENLIKMNCKSKNICVVNRPLSLSECYRAITSNETCVGMRYHSIVMQTLLNGNNYILDYTNGKNGKISSFIDEYGLRKIYVNRYINIFNEKISNMNISTDKEHFSFDITKFKKDKDEYVMLLKRLFEITEAIQDDK